MVQMKWFGGLALAVALALVDQQRGRAALSLVRVLWEL